MNNPGYFFPTSGKFQMVRTALRLVFWLFCPVFLFGQNPGTVIEEEWTMSPMFGMPGSVRKVKTTLSAGRMRRDEMDSSQTVLLLPDLGKLWLLRPKTKTYIEMDRETLRGLSMMAVMLFGIGMDAETGKPLIPDSLFTMTGNEKPIGPWICSEVRVRRPQGNPIMVWISRNTGLDSGQYASVLKNLMGPAWSDYKAFFRQLDALGGYPVLIEAGSGNRKICQRLTDVRMDTVFESFFRVPAGYKKVESVDP
jgi:hypothetical protein